MTSPKHLWSGDWERESDSVKRAGDPLDPLQTDQPIANAPEQPVPTGTRRRPLTVMLAAVAALAVIVGAAFGLNALFNPSSGAGHPRNLASIPPHLLSPGRRSNPPAPPNFPQQPQIPQASSPQPSGPPVNSNPPPSSGPSSYPTVYWLGMQIETIAPGDVVIDTVRLGSPADQAGLNPGEEILAVNGHELISAPDIEAAIRGLHVGQPVTLEVIYGSSTPQTVALRFAAPPSRHP